MATLQDVRDRLERAVGRLETAQRGYKDRQQARLAEAQREALTAGAAGAAGAAGSGPAVEDLVKALEETQAHNQALVEEREALANRIDAVIGRLRGVLQDESGDGFGEEDGQ